MYALVDCNSFFCSVEKVFHPGLEGKPVCVLSNNDGCIVALTPEAKQVGLHRGDPIFKVMDIVKRFNVSVFSGNLMLYAAMSKRVTGIMRKSIMHVENYSIDESFCDLAGYERHYVLTDFMRSVATKIKTWTDIPVSVGIAPSKTLAKMGSKFAKQYAGYRGVCAIDTEEKRLKALELFDLSDVWGIGRQTFEKLNYYGIRTPLDFALKSESWVRSHFTKPGVQTWMELNGIPCIDTTEVKRNKTICTSRSFGEMVTTFDSLRESVATFASSCANKLRAQSSGAKQVTVFISSNRFREDHPQYGNAATVQLLTPSSDTIEIAKAAFYALSRIYIPGIMYKRSGVVVSDIHDMNGLQLDLFDPVQKRPEREQLMNAIDNINHRYGLKSVSLASTQSISHKPSSTNPNPSWHLKAEYRSPNYLTNLDEIPEVRC